MNEIDVEQSQSHPPILVNTHETRCQPTPPPPQSPTLNGFFKEAMDEIEVDAQNPHTSSLHLMTPTSKIYPRVDGELWWVVVTQPPSDMDMDTPQSTDYSNTQWAEPAIPPSDSGSEIDTDGDIAL